MKSPFKFLDAYTKEDEEIFFGRDNEIEELYEKIYKSNLLLLYGSSGTGKTSLIQCGLANRIPSTDWLPIFVRREQNLLTSIENQIKELIVTAVETLENNETDKLIGQLQSLYLDYFKPIYLIFDQFEELFISGSNSEKQSFFKLLQGLLFSNLQIKIIISIREEYLAQLTEMEQNIPELFDNRMRVENMTPQRVLEVIEETCNAFHIPLENKEISKHIYKQLSDKNGVVELPHLQVYLDRLYREGKLENDSALFSEELIKKTGNLDDVLATFLNEQVSYLPKPELGWKLLKFFITDKGTKKTVDKNEWNKFLEKNATQKNVLSDSLKELINHRVIRYRDRENSMELSHDSLALRVFENLSKEERQLIEVKNFLISSYQNYKINGSYLGKKDIPFIEPYISRMNLTNDVEKFFLKSKLKIKRKRITQIVLVIGIISVLSIITIFSIVQMNKAKHAQEQAVISRNNAIEAKKEAKLQQTNAENALADFTKERDKNIRNRIKELLETVESYKEAGYYKNAEVLLDSIQKLENSLE